MAVFVHIADARNAGWIRRGGVKPHDYMIVLGNGAREKIRCVFCVPVVPNFSFTFQWLRELKSGGYREAVGVQFRIPDDEPVWYGYFGKPHEMLIASQAVGRYLHASDPHGYEVLIPRKIVHAEIMSIRRVPQLVGWRYIPNNKNRGERWWPGYKGVIGLRRKIRVILRSEKKKAAQHENITEVNKTRTKKATQPDIR